MRAHGRDQQALYGDAGMSVPAGGGGCSTPTSFLSFRDAGRRTQSSATHTASSSRRSPQLPNDASSAAPIGGAAATERLGWWQDDSLTA